MFMRSKKETILSEKRTKVLSSNSDATQHLILTRKMLEEDIPSLCKLYDKADVNLLEINSVIFTDKTTDSLVLLISKLTTLQGFKIRNSKIMKNQLPKIMEALVVELTLNSLTFETTIVQKKGIKLVCQLLERSNLSSLSLVQTGIDNAQLSILANGIAKSDLSFLNLTHNIFQGKGFESLMQGLQKKLTVTQLVLTEVYLHKEQKVHFQDFLIKGKDKIKALSLVASNISDDVLGDIITTLSRCSEMRELNLSKNGMSDKNCENLVKSLQNHINFTNLGLSHVRLSDHGIISLLLGFSKSNLQYLNISRNHLTPAIADQLCYFLQQTPSLKKIHLQHNNFDEVCMQKLGETLMMDNISLQYLDVSSNNFSDTGLLALLRPLSKKFAKLHTLACRQNKITGENCTEELSNLLALMLLRVIDLSHNDVKKKTAKALLSMAKHQAMLEYLDLNGNRDIPFKILDEIIEECVSNLLIQERVVPYINQQKKDANVSSSMMDASILSENALLEGGGKSLSIENQQFESIDFLFKYVHLAKSELRSVSFKNLKQSPNTTKVWLRHDILHIRHHDDHLWMKTIKLENFDIDEAKLTQLLKDVAKLANLQNLGLNKIWSLKNVIDVLEKVATEHPELNRLELRDNELSDLSFVPRLLKHCVTLSILDLRGNSVNDNDIRSITEGLKNNIDMRTILYDHNEKNGQTAQGKALREAMIHELKLNFFCDVFISPKAIELPEISSGRGLMIVDLTDEPNLNLEALCKYLALKDVLELSLKRTKLNAQLLSQLVEASWSKMPLSKRMMVKLDLSENPDLDCNSCHVIESIIKNLPFLTTLNLSSTSIQSEGLLTVVNSLKTSLTLGCLMLDDCKIDMHDQDDYKQVVEKLSINCGLTILGLAGNSICEEALDLVCEQLGVNRHIKALILPQIRDQVRKIGSEPQNSQRETLEKASKKIESALARKFLIINKEEAVSAKKSFIDFRNIQSIKNLDKNLELKRDKTPIKERASEDSESEESVFVHQRHESFNEKPLEESVEKLFIKLKYLDYEFTSLKFLTKFVKTFPNVSEIDFYRSKVEPEHILELVQMLKTNKFITSLLYDQSKVQVDLKTKELISTELLKNKKMMLYFSKEVLKLSFTNNFEKADTLSHLDLSRKKLYELDFVAKICWGYNQLKEVDLSNNDLGPEDMVYMKDLVTQQKNLVSLNLANNHIVSAGLHLLCSALVGTEENPVKLKSLNIESNQIPDEDLKMLLALFQRNLFLLNIKYSLVKPDNIAKFKSFELMQDESLKTIKKKLLKHHHVHYKLWEYIFFPVYLWKSFIHAKHEAFRFKYVTRGLLELENGMMRRVNVIMYINALVYYVIVLFFPLFFINECYKGIENIAHFIYIAYAVANIIFEAAVVLYVARKLNSYKDKVIELNRWHIVEILFGQIARFDTYLDLCFLSIMLKCGIWQFYIPVAIFVVLSLVYPIFILSTKVRTPISLKHTMANIERLCQICFIRENMLLATLLDSVCINNMQNLPGGRRVVFGKLQATLGLFLQDFPQLVIHLIFLFAWHDDELHHNYTVTTSLAISVCAIFVSAFNFVMFKPNEFDPILLEYELKKRRKDILFSAIDTMFTVNPGKRRQTISGIPDYRNKLEHQQSGLNKSAVQEQGIRDRTLSDMSQEPVQQLGPSITPIDEEKVANATLLTSSNVEVLNGLGNLKSKVQVQAPTKQVQAQLRKMRTR